MTMQHEQLTRSIGRTLVDDNGDRIGKIVDLYQDEATGQPEWIAVSIGRLGSNISFVPLAHAQASGDDLRVPYTVDHVKAAPDAEADGQLTQQEEGRLYQHYGLPYSEDRSSSGLPDSGRSAAGGGKSTNKPTPGGDTSGPSTDDAMTRSEEELQVGTERREAGRARLRKYIVTEEQTRTVPVTREEVRVEREPITEDNVDAAMSGPDISDEEHEVVLHEEVPVVSKKTVPKERVRLDTETVTDDRKVTEDVRKERIEVEGDTPRGR
jgi:uncharacterized protein (TIGR02271 family)